MIIVLVITKKKSLGTNFNQENWMLVIWLKSGTGVFFIKYISSFSFSKRSAIYQWKFFPPSKLTFKNQTWFPLIDQDHATLNELKKRYTLILIEIMHYARKINVWLKLHFADLCLIFQTLTCFPLYLSLTRFFYRIFESKAECLT